MSSPALAPSEPPEPSHPTPALADELAAALRSADAPTRASALAALRALRIGSTEDYCRGRVDPDPDVRLQAVRGLVSLREADEVSAATGDPEPRVRLAVADGLGSLGEPSSEWVLRSLAADAEQAVRAAARAALGALRVGEVAPVG